MLTIYTSLLLLYISFIHAILDYVYFITQHFFLLLLRAPNGTETSRRQNGTERKHKLLQSQTILDLMLCYFYVFIDPYEEWIMVIYTHYFIDPSWNIGCGEEEHS